MDLSRKPELCCRKESIMEKKRNWFALALLCLLSLCFTGCSNGLWAWLNAPADGRSSGGQAVVTEPSDKPVDYDKVYKISIASGASGGGYYMIGATMAQVLQEHDPNLHCSSESTGGTSENIALITREESSIGMGMADDIVSAYKGERDYQGRAADNLRVVSTGTVNTFQVFVLASSPIYTLADLKGKVVSLGPSGAPYFGPDLLESTCGLVKDKDYTGQYLAHDQAADALSDGNVDAVIATLAYPASAYANLAFTKDVRVIPISEEEMARAQKVHPTWVKSTIPKGTYNKQDKDVTSLAIPVWFFTYADLDEDAVYRVTKILFENTEEMGKIYKEAGRFKLDTALVGVNIPVHPGATKYYRERQKEQGGKS